MAEEEVTIGFRGTADYRTKLQRAALDRGVKVQQLIERALSAFLEGTVAATSRTPKGYKTITVKEEMVPIMLAMAKWIETEGRDAVLASFHSPVIGEMQEASVESKRDSEPAVPKSARKLRPA